MERSSGTKMGYATMNRIDHSAEITVIRNNIEKKVNLPFICDDQLWFQVLKSAVDHKVIIPSFNLTIDSPIVEPAPK